LFLAVGIGSPKRLNLKLMLPLFQRVSAFLLFWATLFFAGHLSAQSVPDTHAKVELIAEQSNVPSGNPLWVGVLFRLDKGWHIYWQNPGDSGEPPKVEWQLPRGLVARPIRWPQPIRLEAGTIVDYGYEGQVLLMAPIEAAGAGKTLSATAIAADVKYIICREMCIPARAHLTLSKPPGGDWVSWHTLFQQTQQQLPKTPPAGWKISAESNSSHFIISVRGTPDVQGARFFPLDPNQVENSSPQDFASNQNGFRLMLKKSDQMLKPISALRGVIVLSSGFAFEVAPPVVSAR
jgi:thiol:disulfide interchange protein DsbD